MDKPDVARITMAEPKSGVPTVSKKDFSQELKFQQYRLFVDTAERNSDRRASTQRFYTAMHTSLLTLLIVVGGYGLLGQNTSLDGQRPDGSVVANQVQAPIVIAACVIGVMLAILWHAHLQAFRRLSAAKFKIINDMEEDMPYQAFMREWEALNGADPGMKRRHVQLTALERVVPLIAILFYMALGIAYLLITKIVQVGITFPG